MALIQFDKVSLGYAATPVVAEATFAIDLGAFAGIVGPSGAGKTTILRALLGGVPRMTGMITVDGRGVRPGHPAHGIGYVPQLQTVDWSFPVTVDEVVLLGRTMRSGLWPWPRPADRIAARRVLDRLGIGHLAGRHIRDLSGGQQQRVFLARALISEPNILLLDEPTSGVDIKTRDDILHLLGELNRDGVTILLTTHELNSVAAHLPEVLCVNRGLVAHGAPDDVFTTPILSRTYGADLHVVRQDGLLLVADAAPHRLRDALRHHHEHEHSHDETAPHSHRHEHP